LISESNHEKNSNHIIFDTNLPGKQIADRP
jgi:hypothetical protein